jgi:hypothetical protein
MSGRAGLPVLKGALSVSTVRIVGKRAPGVDGCRRGLQLSDVLAVSVFHPPTQR